MQVQVNAAVAREMAENTAHTLEGLAALLEGRADHGLATVNEATAAADAVLSQLAGHQRHHATVQPRRRRAMPPTTASPTTIIAQAPGSGTASSMLGVA